ncbi:uncharacterized protein LOC113360599 [Papaver somniferum]|uniref:uncharacterized protein LOC113360599 n=1 Tax=Papaver somniferum TaxID=3469 RepID=UPI000E70044C|nr:uncharacterized protein LOC113360599 [Papaver somniferum]
MTVHIHRTIREDLIRAKLLFNAAGNQYKAGVSYETKLDDTIYGATGEVNVWNPYVHQDQFSSAEIALQSGSGEQINVIKFGWTVNSQLYGDNVTRGFAYWTNDGGSKTGCYNTLCRGFVQVHSKYTPDMPFIETSKVGGVQVIFNAQIAVVSNPKTAPGNQAEEDACDVMVRDNVEGKWWLTLQNNIRIGYWPKLLFPAFSPVVASIFWGGRVKSGVDGMSPPMCSGQPIENHFVDAGYIGFLQYADVNNFYKKPVKTESIIDCSEHYTAAYYPDLNNVFFGGSGGANCF